VLAKDAHGHTLRLAPPIVIEEQDLVFAVDQLADALHASARVTLAAS
jgi:ornithine--oxo-acid transaminase